MIRRRRRCGTRRRRCRRGAGIRDGSFHGRIPLMASSMELEKDRPFDALVDIVIPQDQAGIRDGRSASPATAVSIRDRSRPGRARPGAVLSRRSIGCSRCHGVYDGRGNVDWPGVHADVGTDPARRDIVSDGFIEAFNVEPARRRRLARSRAAAMRRRR